MGKSPWGDDDGKLEEQQEKDRMGKFLESVLFPGQKLRVFAVPSPKEPMVTMEMRKAVLNELSRHIEQHVPPEQAYAMKCTMLHYGCNAQVNEPWDDSESS